MIGIGSPIERTMDHVVLERLMRRALVLAHRGQGYVEPNPMVGAVLVRDGKILAEGFHRQFGAEHAEINVLRKCEETGVESVGCDLFVTLEPCSHHGKTPPCTDAIIHAGIKRVFVAMVDPNPIVAGKGVRRLERAGIIVEVGRCYDNARVLNEPYVKRLATGRPWVIAKWAQTLEGRIATRTGDSQWISNSRSRRLVHQLRARVDAVIVGIGTVLADDPRLTARDVRVRRVARRVVIDPKGRLPASARILDDSDSASPLTIVVNQDLLTARSSYLKELESRGVELVGLPQCEKDSSRLNLRPLMDHLAGNQLVTNVLVEGGARLLSELCQQELVDQVLVFVAPKLLGDANALSAIQGLLPIPSRIDQALSLALRTVKRMGDDVMLDYRVVS